MTNAVGRMAEGARHQHLADEGLVDAIARQDQTALAEIYSRHGTRVHALARALCGPSRGEALTQDVFLRFWDNPHRFDSGDGSLRSYLLMQTHERAVSLLRGGRGGAARAERSGSEAVALKLLERAEIEELVAGLPTVERHPIVLAYFGGHSYREVARLLAVPEATIKSRIRSGLKRLGSERSLFARSEGFEPPTF